MILRLAGLAGLAKISPRSKCTRPSVYYIFISLTLPLQYNICMVFMLGKYVCMPIGYWNYFHSKQQPRKKKFIELYFMRTEKTTRSMRECMCTRKMGSGVGLTPVVTVNAGGREEGYILCMSLCWSMIEKEKC